MLLLTLGTTGTVLILGGSVLMIWPAILLAHGLDHRRSLMVHVTGGVLVLVGVMPQRAMASFQGLVVLLVVMGLLVLPMQLRLTRRTRASRGSQHP